MTDFNDDEFFDIYVHEIENNGDIDEGRKCPISDFHGVVPAFGDVYIKPWDGLKPPYFAGKLSNAISSMMRMADNGTLFSIPSTYRPIG
jgi:hypothetical protein